MTILLLYQSLAHIHIITISCGIVGGQQTAAAPPLLHSPHPIQFLHADIGADAALQPNILPHGGRILEWDAQPPRRQQKGLVQDGFRTRSAQHRPAAQGASAHAGVAVPRHLRRPIVRREARRHQPVAAASARLHAVSAALALPPGAAAAAAIAPETAGGRTERPLSRRRGCAAAGCGGTGWAAAAKEHGHLHLHVQLLRGQVRSPPRERRGARPAAQGGHRLLRWCWTRRHRVGGAGWTRLLLLLLMGGAARSDDSSVHLPSGLLRVRVSAGRGHPPPVISPRSSWDAVDVGLHGVRASYIIIYGLELSVLQPRSAALTATPQRR